MSSSRRRILLSNKKEEEQHKLLFFAPLVGSHYPLFAHDNVLSIYNDSSNSSLLSLIIENVYAGILWDSAVPQNKDLTFNCWISKSFDASGVNYSIGAATKDNARYKGLQYCEYQTYWLMQEYLYFCNANSTNYLTELNNAVFISWSIKYNGNNNYTCKFYKNAVLQNTFTFTNNSWLGMVDSFFAISHFNNSLLGSYMYFSCYEMLSNKEIATLYNNNGLPTFTKNYIVNMPLTEDDISDHVSGSNSWSGKNSNTMSWNAGKGAWQFTAKISPAYITGLSFPSDWSTSTNRIAVYEADIYSETYGSTNKRACLFGTQSGSATYSWLPYYGATSQYFGGIATTGSWHHVKVLCDVNGYCIFFTDDIITGLTGIRGVDNNLGNNLAPLGARWNADTSTRCYIKNIEIYTLS